MDVVCLFRTLSVPDDLVSVRSDTISMLFWLKWCHETEGGMCLVWNSNFGSILSHSTFYRNEDLVSLLTDPLLSIPPFLMTWLTIFGPEG